MNKINEQGGASRGVDIYIVYKFIKFLAKPWTDWEAYELGIIDDEGRLLKKNRKTKDEKNNYTLFHRLIRNLKRLLEKIPGGKSKLGKATAAYFLLREEIINMGASKEQINAAFTKYLKEEENVETALIIEAAIETEDFGITFEDAVTTADVAIIPTPLVSDPDGKTMGMYYYTCSPDVYAKCMKGKRKTGRWQLTTPVHRMYMQNA